MKKVCSICLNRVQYKGKWYCTEPSCKPDYDVPCEGVYNYAENCNICLLAKCPFGMANRDRWLESSYWRIYK